MFPESFMTARLTLRLLRGKDARAIFDSYGQDAEVTRYLSWRPHRSIDDAEAYVQMSLKAQNARIYMLILRETGELIGALDLRRTGSAKLEYGCVLARPFWGRGLMTEAVTEAADWALLQPGIWRFGGLADIDNIGSIRVMEKAGLQREGVLRRWLVHPNMGDTPRDSVSYAKVR